MKSIIAIAALSVLSAPAFAGPYANVENNAAWIGSDFEVGVTEVHAGYEIYGEVAFLTEDQEVDVDTLSLGTKIGATYRF